MKLIFVGIDFTQDLSPLVNEFITASKLKDRRRENPFIEKRTDATAEEPAVEKRKDEAGVFYQALSEGEEFLKFVTDEEHFEIYMNDRLMCNEKLEKVTGIFRSDYRNQLMRAVYRILSEKLQVELPWGILTGVRPTKLLLERMEKGNPTVDGQQQEKSNPAGEEQQHEKGNQVCDGQQQGKDDIRYMQEQYYCSEEKAGLAHIVAEKEMKILKDLDYSKGYSLYVGIPFCPSICNYCTFGSHPINRYAYLVEPYIEALCKEIEATGSLIKDKQLQTVYFGGGTPTAISAEQLRRVIRKVKECFDFTYVREFTVEAGRPDSIDREKLEMLKEEVVTRISINPQSMRERTLELIGRRHTAEQTVSAFRLAREVGFDNINMDLIAGLSGENEADMRYTLSEIEKLDPDSITVHTLALKRAARLNTESESFAGLEASGVGNMVKYAADYMKAHSYKPYYMYRQKNQTENLENVGYAREGKEGFYNVLIMEEKQQILALGAGASSKFIYRHGNLNKKDNQTENINQAEDKNQAENTIQTENENPAGKSDIGNKSEICKRFGRVENVKSVVDYVNRIDEMIERKLSADI